MNAINSKFNDDREVVASENLQQAMLELLHEEEESVVRVKCIAGRVKLTVLVRNREDCAADEADALVDEEQEAPPLTPPPSQPQPQLSHPPLHHRLPKSCSSRAQSMQASAALRV